MIREVVKIGNILSITKNSLDNKQDQMYQMNKNNVLALWMRLGGMSMNFSYEEQVVGTWVDGRTVYQKTIDMGQMNKGSYDVDHNIENLDIVISIMPILRNGNSLTYETTDTNRQFNITKTQVKFYGPGWTHTDNYGYVTLLYTKISD